MDPTAFSGSAYQQDAESMASQVDHLMGRVAEMKAAEVKDIAASSDGTSAITRARRSVEKRLAEAKYKLAAVYGKDDAAIKGPASTKGEPNLLGTLEPGTYFHFGDAGYQYKMLPPGVHGQKRYVKVSGGTPTTPVGAVRDFSQDGIEAKTTVNVISGADVKDDILGQVPPGYTVGLGTGVRGEIATMDNLAPGQLIQQKYSDGSVGPLKKVIGDDEETGIDEVKIEDVELGTFTYLKVDNYAASKEPYILAGPTPVADGPQDPGGAPVPPPKPPKPIKGKQENQGHSIAMLDLAPGDKIQMKKGGWTYELTKPAAGLSGEKGTWMAQAVNGSAKVIGYSQVPQFVTKADGSKLEIKEPEAASSEPVTQVSQLIPGVHAARWNHDNSVYQIAKNGPTGVDIKLLGGGTMNYSSESLQNLMDKGKVTIVNADGSAGTSAAAPIKSAATLQLGLKAPTGADADKPMKDYPDGTVISTPDGQVAILMPSEDAYNKGQPGGYIKAYNVATGTPFEPPADVPPVQVSTHPTLMADAAATLKAAQSSEGTVTQTAGGATSTVATDNGPPAKFHGALTGHAAEDTIAKWGFTSPLSDDQRSEVHNYQGSSNSYNNPLRHKTILTGDEAYARGLRIKRLEHAINQVTPFKEPVILVRKTDYSEWTGATAGDVITDRGFFSTSTHPDAISDGGVFGDGGGGAVEIHALFPKGSKAISTQALPDSSMSSEHEVIGQHGSLFHVLKTEKKPSGITILYVELIP